MNSERFKCIMAVLGRYELTPLLHKDAIESTVCPIKRRFPTFLGYFLKATLGLIEEMALISRPSPSGEGFDESRRRI